MMGRHLGGGRCAGRGRATPRVNQPTSRGGLDGPHNSNNGRDNGGGGEVEQIPEWDCGGGEGYQHGEGGGRGRGEGGEYLYQGRGGGVKRHGGSGQGFGGLEDHNNNRGHGGGDAFLLSDDGADGGRGGGYSYPRRVKQQKEDDGDYFGDGRVEPADPRQDGTSLADRYAAEADTLLKEFDAKAIRARPMFPVRPGYGAAGTPYAVRANHFFRLGDDKVVHQYDVTITPEPTKKDVRRAVLSKLVSVHRQACLGGRPPAYDGRKFVFTVGELPLENNEFEVTLTADDHDEIRTKRNYTVAIKHDTAITLEQLQMFLAGYSTDIPRQALQFLDIVVHDIVLSESETVGYIPVGQSFFSERIGLGRKDLGQDLDLWKGFYQNGLSLVVDISPTAFIQPQGLVKFVRILSNNFTDLDPAVIQKVLKGVRIEVTHRENERRKYRIRGLSSVSAKELEFVSSSLVGMTVKDYFSEAYNVKLKYDFLPCVQVGNEQRQNFLPMEVCKIVCGQHYKKNLARTQSYNPMRLTCKKPSAPEESTRQVIDHNKYNGPERANEFDIQVDNNSTEIEARVLLSPTLMYSDSGSTKTCQPSNGAWNMEKKKVLNGGRVSNWLCVNFCHDLSNDDVSKFCVQLAERSQNTGMDFRNRYPLISNARPDEVEDHILQLYEDERNRSKGQKIDLLLAILPDANGRLYGNIKRICETHIGVMSQCCRKENVLNLTFSCLTNIAIKINAKAGGRNTILRDQASLPVVSNKPTIIFGADVTHPAALDDSAPSIASVVASQEWPEVFKYNGLVRTQGHREELISGLEDIVKELLVVFEKESGKRPEQLIFYRDGVSEGQFKQVYKKEIPEIEKAWKAQYSGAKPQITFIVVQKGHHTRLFPKDNKDERYAANQGNILPGTVVDRKICHPTEFDFFLCSHAAGVKGTSRPIHYHVLRDDNNFTADQLQSLTNNLCYTYASCTRSVSIAPPAYYAHKLASRARYYLTQGPNNGAAGGSNPIPAIKDEVKRSMFYC